DRPQPRDNSGGNKASQSPAQKASPKTPQRTSQPARPSQPRRDTAFSDVQSGARTSVQANRGRQSVGHGGGAPRMAGGGGRGGRRADVALKPAITLPRRPRNRPG